MRTQALSRINVAFFLCAFFVLNTFSNVWAQSSDLAEKLRSGDHILLIRHALAPGVGDPANYTLADCRTQRNLSQEGRQQAVRLGEWLRKQGVAAADVYSSPWCRCKDTAELMQFGGFKVEPTLASFFDDMSKAKASTQALHLFVTKTLKDKGHKALILVTHHVNIYEYAGENIDSGDMVLVKVDRQGKMLSYQRIARPS
jgi:phosphohistidine phosphatase SixA